MGKAKAEKLAVGDNVKTKGGRRLCSFIQKMCRGENFCLAQCQWKAREKFRKKTSQIRNDDQNRYGKNLIRRC